MLGRFNVSYNDINALAYPVLRHRMKLTFEAIAERISPDEIITMIIKELNGKKVGSSEKTEEKTETATPAKEEAADTVAEGKEKRKLFRRK
jgi:MoxR-like ATPase